MKNLAWILSLCIVLVGMQVGIVGSTFGTDTATTTAIPSETNLSQTAFAVTEYQLPYPGILPDSPLYFLKAARDKIISFIISDPAKKAEFNLLEADKRLNAGLYLYQKKKYSLIVTTISKGENYFEEAVVKVEEAKRGGQDVNYLIDKMRTSLLKHSLIINDLKRDLPKENQSGIDTLAHRVTVLQNKVNKLRPIEQ